jgi:tRNA-uridine 2-sulfurtransferase
MTKAVALFSGGLDSSLAVLMMLRQGIDVTALFFLTHFGCSGSDISSCSAGPFPAVRKFGFDVRPCNLTDRFIDIVKKPAFGRGKNMNPCIDCRILMLGEAKGFMRMTGAEFIVTGEVLGQRPMSQRRDTFNIIDRESGLRGYVLRPLSAKLLPETVPEKEGLVDRDMLCGLSGRSRKPQMRLAKEFGLTDYPAPAGGCLLAEPNYAYRLKELLDHNPDPSLTDLLLLKVGRHFRASPSSKIIIGRDEKENGRILSLAGEGDHLLKIEGVGSPIALISGKDSGCYIDLSASLCARYSDAKHLGEARATVVGGADAAAFMDGTVGCPGSTAGINFRSVRAAPAGDDVVQCYRIERRKKEMVRDAPA